MISYDNLKSTSQLNLKEFAEQQKLIWTKYDSLENGLSLKKSEKEFINNFDRYILHALEEVYEVQGAYTKCISESLETLQADSIKDLTDEYIVKFAKNITFRDYIFEIIDVAMYCGTMYSIIQENLSELSNLNFGFNYVDIKSFKKDVKCDDVCLNTLSNLMAIRTQYGKRKWHKTSNELTEREKLSSVIFSLSVLTETITDLLGYAELELERRGTDRSLLNDALTSKQTFIKELKETN